MLIRRETPADVADVRAVTVAAFTAPPFRPPTEDEPPEAGLLDRLRTDPGWLPGPSLVADEAGAVVGHVLGTRGHLGDVPALAVGPVSVRPDRQRGGVGSALLHAVLGAADALGEPVVVLLGDPAFYGRFGFRPAAELGITAPDPAWGPSFQARPLSAYPAGLSGPFRYAAPFDDV